MSYKIVSSPINEEYKYVEFTDDAGLVWAVPIDEANSDYQAYLAYLAEQEN